MEIQKQKIYVAIGTDLQDGFGTLEWVLRKWSPHSISIVILLAANKISKHYAYTPFGKLPASSVSDEKLQLLRNIEEEKIDMLLSKYITFCGKVKAKILKMEKYDKPIDKLIVELISELRITKLVMGITSMKSLSWKSNRVIEGSFYVHRNKPNFCELFIVCGRKLVSLREENNEGIVEDEQGVIVAKVRERTSFRAWLGKMFQESEKNSPTSPSSSSTTSNDSPNQWENDVQEIENYFQQLLSSNSNEEDDQRDDDALRTSPIETHMMDNMSASEKIDVLKTKIDKGQEAIQLWRKQAKANVERRAKAEWAICLCTRRVEEIEARINEEISNQSDLKNDINTAKEELYELHSEVEEQKSKLSSIIELQSELSNKLKFSSLSKTRSEAQIQKAVTARAEMIREIEDLRRQRDILHRRIEFCREKDAIGMAVIRFSEIGFNEYSEEEIRDATHGFSEHLRLKSGGDWTRVYKGRISHKTVAIKLCDSTNGLSQEGFQDKVNFLGHIRHPQLVSMVGFCSQLKCIVFEYMHNGCLRDTLFSLHRGSRRRNRGLNWHARIRIAAEVCSGLVFLHMARPRPIIHGNLNPSKILLDHNFVAKIQTLGLTWSNEVPDVRSDIRAFGNLVLQLLTGRNWAGLVEEAIVMDPVGIVEILDEMAGEWPPELAIELVGVAIRCLSTNNGLAMVMGEIAELKKKADDLAAIGGCEVAIEESGEDMEDSINVPRVFFCPILQEPMKNPHVAADGFSYELEAIDEWLRTGHDTSPMTNLKLKHKHLTPNQTLRSFIQDWYNRRPIPIT